MNHNDDHIYEVIIIGAGPIGIELALALKEAGVDYLHLDAKQVGYTMTWWPRNTNFFSTPERVAICGIPLQSTHQGRTTGEEYQVYLRSIVETFNLPINTYEKVVELTHHEMGFHLRTETLTGNKSYTCRQVVLAKGDMDSPNLLNIPGEDLSHVSHYFIDPHAYFRKKLLIVGGKNSAVEAALRCWRAGAEVAISYRRAEFSDRVKEWILPDLKAQIEIGNIKFYPETTPLEIKPGQVSLGPTKDAESIPGDIITHEADFVLLCTGFVADMTLFEKLGVNLLGESRIPEYNSETMETNVPGLYLAGTVAAGERQKKYRLFIENSHDHVRKIVTKITGSSPERLGSVAARNYDIPFVAYQAN